MTTKKPQPAASKKASALARNVSRPLNAKVLRFVDEYLVDMNATQAAIRAGYSAKTAYAQGQRLLKKAEVQAAISAGMAARSQRTKITQDMVLEELAKLAFSDPRAFFREDGTLKHPQELDDRSAAALAQFEVREEFEREDPDEAAEAQPHGGELRRQYGRKRLAGYTTKVKWADKRAALVDIGKHLGMFIDRKEIRMGELERASDEDLARRIAAAAQQVADIEGVPVETVLQQVQQGAASKTVH
ncbi:MAG: terminase small subunit [Burkholderiales bacterium]|nr:terminase small subunit [Burkholderiales bacterium]